MIDLEDKLTVDPPPQHDAKELMIPCVQLSKVFPVRPGGRYLHVFVQRPYNGSYRSHFQPLSPSALLDRIQQLRSEWIQNFLLASCSTPFAYG